MTHTGFAPGEPFIELFDFTQYRGTFPFGGVGATIIPLPGAFS